MKIITLLLFTVILNACGGAKEASNSAAAQSGEDVQNETLMKNLQNLNVALEYSAITRGSFYELKMSNKKATIQKNRNDKPTEKTINDTDWKDLMLLVDITDLKGMPAMEAPSKARFYDGAPIGEFKIIKDGETYAVPNFDAGKPNKGVADLINKMLAIVKDKE
ncbi:hypothetical protein [Pontimicrobium sp. MEBiC01747]